MGESGDEEPDDRVERRVDRSRLLIWLLLDANRWVLAGAVLAAVFVALVVLGHLAPTPLSATFRRGDPGDTLFQALLTAIITGVTLVVTIGQLVLSQELGGLGDQRQRMDGAMAFESDVEETLRIGLSPPEPSAFLRTLLGGLVDVAEQFRDQAADGGEDVPADRIDDYVEELTTNAEAVMGRLQDEQFGTFAVVSAALDFNYSWKIFEARRFRERHGDALSPEARRTLDRLIDSLSFFGPAREHVKTLYFQWELVNLSRVILYASIPALVVSVAGIIYLDGGVVSGRTLGLSHLVLLVSAMVAISLVPFVVLLSYILRIVTVAKRTLAIGPFVLRSTGREEDSVEG